MKKFVFTNERYMGIKSDEYDALKRTLQNVDKNIELVLMEMRALEHRFDTERVTYNKACTDGVRVEQLRTYQWFFPYLLEEQKKLAIKLQQLEEERRRLRDQLVKLHNELKVLEKMKEEQYAAYLKEVANDEAKELDSFLSYTIYEGAV
ncbi:flagellar export protein FliJ [Christensenellaceae bacterium OttesenSCG-928-M15]|nr:flagellar export protein FliJ [Christensenellaceae bacterium OttesenSCG-928-M15]